jgi:hypothetical protein
LFGRDKDLHGVCTTKQPHRLAKGAQSREQHHQQGSNSFVSSVVDQNNIDHFFFLLSKQGVMHKEFVPAAKTVNTEFCALESLLK